MITITISGESPEVLQAHTAWLANKIGAIDVIADVHAKRHADNAITKAKQETVTAPVDSAAPVDSGVSSADKVAVQKLAQAKSKTSGAAAVKETIARFGGATINDTSAEKMAELRAALEALA